MSIAAKNSPGIDRDVSIGILQLPGHLFIPEQAKGLVIFAHGSGSSRFSTRNRKVAEALHASGIGSLLFDLLTMEEEQDRRNVFDIEVLSERLDETKSWLATEIPDAKKLPFGYFGASTGAGAALAAAARSPDKIRAIVSRGGRPDLAGESLRKVKAPTLLIVGGADRHVIGLNLQAYELLSCQKKVEIVPNATHLFEEPGALERVTELAKLWFLENF